MAGERNILEIIDTIRGRRNNSSGNKDMAAMDDSFSRKNATDVMENGSGNLAMAGVENGSGNMAMAAFENDHGDMVMAATENSSGNKTMAAVENESGLTGITAFEDGHRNIAMATMDNGHGNIVMSPPMKNSSGNMTMTRVKNARWNMARDAMYYGPGKKAKVMTEAAPLKSSTAITVTMNPNLLECCACFGPLIPPLFQCSSGHITSSECRSNRAFQCAMCRPVADITTRCRAMERVLGGLTVPCSFQEQGCTKMVPYKEKAEHEKSCPHAASYCPVPGCRRRRYTDGMSLLDHLNREHPEITRTGIPLNSLCPVEMRAGEGAHVVCLDVGDREEEYRSMFLLLLDDATAGDELLQPPERALSVVRLMAGPFHQDEYKYKYMIRVCARSDVLSLSGETKSVARLTKPYAARASLIVPAAMWSPGDSPVYIELKRNQFHFRRRTPSGFFSDKEPVSA